MHSPTDEPSCDLRILTSLRQIMRSVDQHSRQLARQSGLTVPQLVCLLKVGELGPLAQKDLADAIYLSPSTVVGIVDRLEGRGLLRRERSSTDRRRVLISLTKNGQSKVVNSPSALQDSLLRALSEIPGSEQEAIASSFERLVGLLSQVSDHVPTDVAPILAAQADLQTAPGDTPLP